MRNATRDVSQSVLVVRDRRTGICIAHAVPFKGAGVEWIAKQMLREVWVPRQSRIQDGWRACPLCWNMEPLGQPE